MTYGNWEIEHAMDDWDLLPTEIWDDDNEVA